MNNKNREKLEKQFDVVALGELLIDFTENGSSEQGNPLFEANPGGAPLQCAGDAFKARMQNSLYWKGGKDFFWGAVKKRNHGDGHQCQRAAYGLGCAYNTCYGTYIS